MAVEGTFKLIDPLAYHVNNVEDLDPEVVKAFKRKDNSTIAELTHNGDTDFDVFICINKAWHAFILCIPNTINDPHGLLSDVPQDNPFVVSGDILCWSFELCFENEQLKLYKIRKEFNMLKDIRNRINKAYHIGKFMNVKPKAFQFAVLRAAPHRYNVLLNDCVEFAKEFCLCMLSYCSNYRQLEEPVNENIKKATATGLSVENLSRRVRSSALIGNTFLGGLDVSTFFSARNGSAGLIVFILVYPIFVACVTAAVIIYVLK
ncbi:uncharacterized protein LOC128556154 [Mercenaria mercenaria]|uniref:uncharacterized protein LOC128556154 n=1 Tax=Mercenaria mercenaria TaxID=6596 RepID=UPI00234EFCE4|nr:uncharacterized protein LOC128556154 [Mercenaria mercenaria]